LVEEFLHQMQEVNRGPQVYPKSEEFLPLVDFRTRAEILGLDLGQLLLRAETLGREQEAEIPEPEAEIPEPEAETLDLEAETLELGEEIPAPEAEIPVPEVEILDPVV
jgi:hypothetical protein